MNNKFIVKQGGSRLDYAISGFVPDISKSQAAKMCKRGQILVNQEPSKPGRIVNKGDEIIIKEIIEKVCARDEIGKKILPLDVVFEDAHLIIINKPREMHCVTLTQEDEPTLADGLVALSKCFLCASTDGREAGLVQRLDYFTSGLIMAAKNLDIWKALHEMFLCGEIKKYYIALVEGSLKDEKLVIETQLVDAGHSVNVKIGKIGDLKRTEVSILKETGQGASLVKIRADRAHRHQIRAHLAYMGHPLVGDDLYGSTSTLKQINNLLPERGFLLHASELNFKHPITGITHKIQAELFNGKQVFC